MKALQDKSPGEHQEGRAPLESERIYSLDNPNRETLTQEQTNIYRGIRKVLK